MTKKELKRRVKRLEILVRMLQERKKCEYCENYKPKTVVFKRFVPLPPIDQEGGDQK